MVVAVSFLWLGVSVWGFGLSVYKAGVVVGLYYWWGVWVGILLLGIGLVCLGIVISLWRGSLLIWRGLMLRVI